MEGFSPPCLLFERQSFLFFPLLSILLKGSPTPSPLNQCSPLRCSIENEPAFCVPSEKSFFPPPFFLFPPNTALFLSFFLLSFVAVAEKRLWFLHARARLALHFLRTVRFPPFFLFFFLAHHYHPPFPLSPFFGQSKLEGAFFFPLLFLPERPSGTPGPSLLFFVRVIPPLRMQIFPLAAPLDHEGFLGKFVVYFPPLFPF